MRTASIIAACAGVAALLVAAVILVLPVSLVGVDCGSPLTPTSPWVIELEAPAVASSCDATTDGRREAALILGVIGVGALITSRHLVRRAFYEEHAQR